MDITEVSRLSGLSVDTIRFYEKSGMLPPIARDGRGWRRFDPGTAEWLCNLGRLRATGMPLQDMRRFAALVHSAATDTATAARERLDILQRHALRLVERQRELDACVAYLNHKIAVYETWEGRTDD
jgi:MerR family transcriptional regulator, aldehyde-responsive regulator